MDETQCKRSFLYLTLSLHTSKNKIKISLPLEIKSCSALFVKIVPRVSENCFLPGILGWSAD